MNFEPDVMSTDADDMNTFIKTLLAVITGALVTGGSIWVETKITEKNDAEAWFYETYVSNGADPLLNYVKNITYLMASTRGMNNEDVSKLPLVSYKEIPVEALTRVSDLIDDEIFEYAIAEISNKTLIDLMRSDRMSGTIQPLKDALQQLKDDLLKMEIPTKRYVYGISSNNEVIESKKRVLSILCKVRSEGWYDWSSFPSCKIFANS